MKPTLIYTYVNQGGIHDEYALRFAESYAQFPPGIEHDTIIAVNGGRISKKIRGVFECIGGMPNVTYFPRSNDGWDIGAYQEIAQTIKTDAMLCLGESVYFHRKDWMMPLIDAWSKHGEGLYGPYASYQNKPHLNTTAFMCSPSLLQSYTGRIVTHSERYQFESSDNNVSFRAIRNGLKCRMVTWDNSYEMGHWRSVPNIMRDGDQSNCLMWCNHTDAFFNANDQRKREIKSATNALSPVAVFYHGILMGGDPPINNNHCSRLMMWQMKEFVDSALFDMASEVYIGINGDEKSLNLAQTMLPNSGKIKWLLHTNHCNDERGTLKALRNWAVTHPGWSACYFHLKGAMHEGKPVVDAWRRCMENAVVTNWWKCAKDLSNGLDMAGSHWITANQTNWVRTPFWGGNFWWAKADYINKLKPISDIPNVPPHDVRAAEAAGGYDVETWIGSGPNPKVKDYTPHWPGESCMR